MSLKYSEPRRITSLTELKPGGHIRVPCAQVKWKKGQPGCWHHMLVVCVWSAQELKVIHYYPGLAGMEVKEEVLDASEFDPIELLGYEKLPPGATECSPREAIDRARSKVGEMGYGLFSNNCEHFINWAKTGVSCSTQVNDAKKAAGLSGGFAAAVVGAVALGIIAVFRAR